MKTSKILLTSLLAAAAMSTVPAWAAATALSGTASEWAYEFDESYKTLTNISSLRNLISGAPDYYVNGDVSGSDGSLKIGSDSVSDGKVSGVLITNANTGTSYFNTNLIGSGVFAVVFASVSGTTYDFTKDLSGFSGDFYVRTLETNRVNTLKFSGTSTSAISGTGTIESNCNVEYAVASGDVTIANSSISAKNLTFSGGANYTVSSAVAGAITVADSTTLNLSGAKVALTSAITNSGTVNVDDKVVFALSGLTGTTNESTTTYSLVNGGTLGDTWTSLNTSNVDISGTSIVARNATASFLSNGSVSVTGTAGDLTWNGGSTGGTWDVQTSKNWLNGGSADEFYTGDNVTFNTSGDVAVTVDSSGVTAGTMTVSAGTVALSGGKVTATSLNVETGAQLNIGNTVSATSLSGAGTVQLSTLSGLSLTGTTKFSDWTGAVVLKDINTGSSGTAFNPNSYGVAGSKVVIDGATGSSFYFLAGNSSGTGEKTFTPDIEIASGGLTLTNGFSKTVYTFSGAISGSGTWKETNKNVAQQYVFTGDVSGFSGTLELQKASKVIFGNGGTGVTGDGKSVSGTGTITMVATSDAASVLTYNYSNDVLASTTLAGGMSVVKQGDGSLTLTGTNTFSGGVTVSKGTLIAGSTSALGTGKTTVAAEAALGLIAGTTVTVAGGVELSEGAKIVVDMSAFTDKAETFALNLITTSALSYNGESITSDNVGTILGDAVTLSNWDKTGWTQSLSYTDNTLSLTMTIPEPSTFGLLAGVGALALVAARRRRRAK